MQQVNETLFYKDMHNMTEVEEDDSAETLSLSDLPLYSNEWEEQEEEDFSSDSQAPIFASSSDHHDHFEFSPQLNPATMTSPFPPENIIFCGKVISRTESSELVDFKEETGSTGNAPRSCLFRWKRTASKQKQEKRDSRSKKMYKYSKHDYSVQKVSILTSSSSGKSKWYLLLLGMPRFSTGVEWTDVKMRRSRSPPSFGFQSGDEVSANRTGGQGLWWLIRALSCGENNHGTTTMVTTLL